MRTRKDQDPWFSPQDLPYLTRLYCDESQLEHPLVSPVFADLTGLPPTLIQVGDCEILLSDSERMAEKMQAAGDEVTLDVWHGMWHVWQMFIGLMPESKTCDRQTRRIYTLEARFASAYILIRKLRIAGTASCLLINRCFSSISAMSSIVRLPSINDIMKE